MRTWNLFWIYGGIHTLKVGALWLLQLLWYVILLNHCHIKRNCRQLIVVKKWSPFHQFLRYRHKNGIIAFRKPSSMASMRQNFTLEIPLTTKMVHLSMLFIPELTCRTCSAGHPKNRQHVQLSQLWHIPLRMVDQEVWKLKNSIGNVYVKDWLIDW